MFLKLEMLRCMASLFFHKAQASHGQWPVLAWSTGPELGQLEVLLKEGGGIQ